LTILAKLGSIYYWKNPQLSQPGEARELYQLALANKVIATLDFEFRFVPAWQQLAETVIWSMWGKSAWSN